MSPSSRDVSTFPVELPGGKSTFLLPGGSLHLLLTHLSYFYACCYPSHFWDMFSHLPQNHPTSINRVFPHLQTHSGLQTEVFPGCWLLWWEIYRDYNKKVGHPQLVSA